MSTTVTLRPTGATGGTGWTYGGGATTVNGALSDDSDATYAVGVPSAAWSRVTFAALTGVPPGAQIRTVAVRLRVSGNGTTLFTAYLYRGGCTRNVALASSKPGALVTANLGRPQVTDPCGQPWTTVLVGKIALQLAATGTAVHFVEAYLDVTYNEVPVVASVGPAGSQTTQTPTVTWQYSDPDGDAQERYRVRVFTAATGAAGGFSADVATAVTDSGDVLSADTSWPVPAPLSAGVYAAYVKAADAGSGGRWSTWASTSFTVVGTPPFAPVLVSAVPDPAAGTVAVTVRQGDNLLTAQQATADGYTGEPVRWQAVTNAGTPVVNAGSGVTGASVRFTATAAGAAMVRTSGGPSVWLPPAGTTVYWGGAIKASAATGSAHADLRCYDATLSDLGTTGRTGGTVTVSTSYQTSSGSAVVPAGAVLAALEWVVTGAAAGQVFDVDNNGVALSAAAVAGRGGLDSRNLLGPGGSTFAGGTTSWVTAPGYPGTVSQVADATAFDGYHLELAPVTVGTGHKLTLANNLQLPVPGGSPRTTARYVFTWASRSNGPAVTVAPFLSWYDDTGAQIGVTFYYGTFTQSSTWVATTFITMDAPAGATHFNVVLYLDGETATTDRWMFDRIFFGRLNPATSYVPMFKLSPGVDTYALVEASDDGGVTWVTVRGTELSVYDPATRLATVLDHEPRGNFTRTYRARTAGTDWQLDPVNGAALVSAPSGTLTATLPVTDFFLIDPYSQTRILLPVIGDVVFASDQPQGVFSPLGRPYPVVTSDVTKGETFTFKLAFTSAADYDAFEVMRRAGHVLFLQSPGARSWYVRLGAPRATTWLMGTTTWPTGGQFTVDIPAAEVGRP